MQGLTIEIVLMELQDAENDGRYATDRESLRR
jgi:hypothetical protein